MPSSRFAACLLAALVVALLAATPADAEQTPTVERMMVWEVPAAVTLAGNAELRVEVLRDGGTVYTEDLTVVVPPATSGGAIEILAGAPETRSLLATLSDRGRVSLEARITREGQELDRLPLAALLDRGASLGERPANLLPLRFDHPAPEPSDPPALFAVTAAGTDCSARSACRQECWNTYYACVEQFCPSYSGSRFLPPECSFCEDDRRSCELSCPPCECTEPKSVTYTTSVQPTSYFWTGSGCYTDFGTEGTWWDRYEVEYKYTKYQHTEACNGTVTTTVHSIWYEYGICWDEDWFSTCSYPMFGTPSPRC